jgi:hypothetical protein
MEKFPITSQLPGIQTSKTPILQAPLSTRMFLGAVAPKHPRHGQARPGTSVRIFIIVSIH